MIFLMAILSVSFSWKEASCLDEIHEEALKTMCFGSCNDQDEPQPLWEGIVAKDPDLFLLLGDNVYADHKIDGKWVAPSLEDLERMYAKQKSVPGYERLRKNTEIRGIYDDHDGCKNDFGRDDCPDLKERQRLMWDFFDEPKDSEKRKRDGVYSSLVYGPPGKRIKFILLDTRSFRDPLVPELDGSPGDILGEEQWKWLEKELEHSDANVHLICSSIQVIPYMHAYLEPLLRVESWSRFPKARERLFETLRKFNVNGVIFLSGDVHYAEISTIPAGCALSYPTFDFTSSGMTHTALDESPLSKIFPSYAPEWIFPVPFKWPRYARKNFGSIEFLWNESAPLESTIRLQVFGVWGKTKVYKEVQLKDLQVQTWNARDDCPSEAQLRPWGRRRLLVVVFISLLLHWLLATVAIFLVLYMISRYIRTGKMSLRWTKSEDAFVGRGQAKAHGKVN